MRCLIFSCEAVFEGKRWPVGGYADRLKGLASAAFLAGVSGRTLLVEWETPRPLAGFFAGPCLAPIPPGLDHAANDRAPAVFWDPQEFDRTYGGNGARVPVVNLFLIDVFAPAEENAARIQHLRRSGLEGLLGSRVEAVRIYLNQYIVHHLMENPVVVGHPVARSAAATGDPWTGAFALLIRGSLSPTAHFCGGDPFAALERRIDAGGVAGVQVRTGGDGGWSDPDFPIPEPAVAAERVGPAAAERGIALSAVFLCSDSERWKAAFKAACPYPVIEYPGPLAHIERSLPQAAGAGMERVVAEHLLLSRCALVLTGGGGFGQTAAWLGCRQPVPLL